MKQDNMKIDNNKIATRAYEFYLARGRQDGRAEEDWLRAEAELRASGAAPVSKSTVEKKISQPTPTVVNKNVRTNASKGGQRAHAH